MRYLLDHSPWLLLANHYVPAQRACMNCDVHTSAITFVSRMMVRPYEGSFLTHKSSRSRARLVFEERL